MVFLTCARFAKKAKSKFILVRVKSTVSGHRINLIRERLGDKIEMVKFDPFIQGSAVYKEEKKVRSL